ncbi:MAG TPA: hypothetical protein VNT27_05415, partial [Propionibacteriaceae bacterium]|nr:hypothetical protein [Propionibacteriaceae bacterium]
SGQERDFAGQVQVLAAGWHVVAPSAQILRPTKLAYEARRKSLSKGVLIGHPSGVAEPELSA